MAVEPEQIPLRRLLPGQRCVVSTHSVESSTTTEVYQSDVILLEAPNWVSDGVLVLNGDGVLWRLDIGATSLQEIVIGSVPPLNNDHVPTADGATIYLSAYDFHLYRAPMWGGTAERVTTDASRPMSHFLHGVSPDGSELALVGIEPSDTDRWGSANIFTMASDGGRLRQLTFGDRPADGPEYSPDGEWIYFNTAAFTTADGHSQIARIRADGRELTQLTFDERVNWFPHVSPDATMFVYLSFESGTIGHPENRNVELRLVREHDWAAPVTIAALEGGQGTINVNSWAPDSSAFAFVSYPLA